MMGCFAFRGVTSADVALVNAAVHTLRDSDPDGSSDAECVVIRDGEILHVGSNNTVNSHADSTTEVIDVEGRPIVPGFIDAHTHLESTGEYLVYADLSVASTRSEALDILATDLSEDREWVIGVGFDETAWPDGHMLTRSDLDGISSDRPVVAFRVDLHTAALNTAAFQRLEVDFPDTCIKRNDGDVTGVVVEDAVTVVRDEIAPNVEQTRDLVKAARDDALSKGVTCVHEMVRDSYAPRIYRELDIAGELNLRVRLNYWRHHLDAILESGLISNHGSAFVRVGGVKSFTDGTTAGRTAKLFEPYADGEGSGQWVVGPGRLREIVTRVDGEGLQLTLHAIGDEAIEETLSTLETTADPGGSRHRIEHVVLATDDQIERLAEAQIVASVQPNLLRWGEDGGLFDRRLGEERSRQCKRYRRLLDAGVPLAFGSDSMPLGPLLGIHQTVNARYPSQRLSVGEALRAYTYGSAYAGFDEARLGTIEVGKKADLVVLSNSPWRMPDAIDEIEVTMTMVDGEVVYSEL